MKKFFSKINYNNYLYVYFIYLSLFNKYKNYINIYTKLITNLKNNKLHYYNPFVIFDIIKFVNLFFKNDIWCIECNYNNSNLIFKYFKKLIIYANKNNILINISFNNIKNINQIYNIDINKRTIIIIKDLNKINKAINEYLDFIFAKIKNKKIIFIVTTEEDNFIVKNIIFKKFNINNYNIIKKPLTKHDIIKEKIINNFNFVNINFIDNINICNKLLDRCIYGQNNLISIIKKNIKISFDYFNKKSKKPLDSWILCGPSGTGKTEIAKILSKSIYGNIGGLLKFDMSEYQESHSISKLIGTPPGYIGYTEGSRLINLINKNPYSVILFDEIEKAHKNINNIMLQILDEGILSSSSGEKGIFKYSFILFTSNLGQSSYYSTENIIDKKLCKKYILDSINKYFSPEFLNRINEILIFDYQNFNCLIKTLDKFFLEFEYAHNTNFIFSFIAKNLLYNLLSNKIYGARILNRQSYKFISGSIELFTYINFNKLININNNKNILNIYKYNSNKSANKGIFSKFNNKLI